MMSTARSVAPVIMTIMLVTLAGCSAIEEIPRDVEAKAPESPPAPKIKPKRLAPPSPRPKPMAALASKREEVAKLAPAPVDPPPAGPPPEAPQYDPRSLIGLNPSQALASLGNPISVLERSPSMVWRYHMKGCALDLFFYMDLGDNAFRVLAYEMKAGTSTEVAARACLGHFRAAADGR